MAETQARERIVVLKRTCPLDAAMIEVLFSLGSSSVQLISRERNLLHEQDM
jgi:hypothetical protein